MSEKAKLPRLTVEELERLHREDRLRPVEEMDIPELGCSIAYRWPDARVTSLIAKSASNEKGDIDNLEFGAKMILEGCVEPKLRPEHIEIIKSLGGTTFTNISLAIRGKKNALSSN